LGRDADLAQRKLELFEKKAAEVRRQLEQFSAVKTFTNMLSGIGQVAAGLRGLTNLTKIWGNENLSTEEKFLQTVSNITMSFPMIINGFSKIGSGLDLISAKILAQNGATFTSIAAQQGLAAAFQQTGIAAWESLGPYLPLALAIATAVGLIVAAYKEWNKEADAAKKANEVAADTKKTYDDLKTSLQDVKSALDDLHSAEENLNGLTKGTQEWRDALQ